jgi:hypothetical protein
MSTHKETRPGAHIPKDLGVAGYRVSVALIGRPVKARKTPPFRVGLIGGLGWFKLKVVLVNPDSVPLFF